MSGNAADAYEYLADCKVRGWSLEEDAAVGNAIL
jgi:hypothetical protein